MRAAARNSDPSTSHKAASVVNTQRLEGVVLNCLSQVPIGLTTHEIEQVSGESLVSVSPRMKPLETRGLVERCGKRVPAGQRVPSIIWRIRQEPTEWYAGGIEWSEIYDV
jgi:hypothetical protein